MQNDVLGKLAGVKAFFDSGVISQLEHEAMRQHVLSSFANQGMGGSPPAAASTSSAPSSAPHSTPSSKRKSSQDDPGNLSDNEHDYQGPRAPKTRVVHAWLVLAEFVPNHASRFVVC